MLFSFLPHSSVTFLYLGCYQDRLQSLDMASNFGLPRSAKLKSRKIISRLFSEGRHVFHYPLKLVFVFIRDPETSEVARMAVSVSKRRFKSAVKRNLAKRRTREAYRLHRNAIIGGIKKPEGYYAIMLIYVGNEIEPYEIIEKGMIQALKKMKHAVQPVT